MTLTDNSPMPFGKHVNTPMANVPAGYLLWLYNDKIKGVPGIKLSKYQRAVRDYVEENMDVLKQEK